jgi:hypothetical protein
LINDVIIKKSIFGKKIPDISMRTFIITILFLIFGNLTFPIGGGYPPRENWYSGIFDSACVHLYEEMNLSELMQFDAFKAAFTGYKKLNNNNSSILTVIDFSLPSTEKRMYVLDLAREEVLYISYVAHGRNSGDNYATSFSNRNGSHKSSLGFYRTGGTYQGSNGYSLLLDGLEKGINDEARSRAIVIHGADYCSEQVIRSAGRLGRSYGCPALPKDLAKPIIDTIKGGSLLFIYSDRTDYPAMSEVV